MFGRDDDPAVPQGEHGDRQEEELWLREREQERRHRARDATAVERGDREREPAGEHRAPLADDEGRHRRLRAEEREADRELRGRRAWAGAEQRRDTERRDDDARRAPQPGRGFERQERERDHRERDPREVAVHAGVRWLRAESRRGRSPGRGCAQARRSARR